MNSISKDIFLSCSGSRSIENIQTVFKSVVSYWIIGLGNTVMMVIIILYTLTKYKMRNRQADTKIEK